MENRQQFDNAIDLNTAWLSGTSPTERSVENDIYAAVLYQQLNELKMSSPSLRREALRDQKAIEDITKELRDWQRPTTALQALFGEQHFQLLDQKRQAVDLQNGTLVYVTYENPWAKSGGITAVAKLLPEALQSIYSGEVMTLSFLHSRIKEQNPKLWEHTVTESLADFLVPWGKEWIPCQILLTQTADLKTSWYLIRALDSHGSRDSRKFFRADGSCGTDPYLDSSEKTMEARDGANSLLLRNSLFAAKAVPFALQALGKTRNLIVHVQDWELAAAALTVKEAMLGDDGLSFLRRTPSAAARNHEAAPQFRPDPDNALIDSAVVVITSHNPYDHWLPRKSLQMITGRAEDRYWKNSKGGLRQTFYARMIELADAPLSTVSPDFARDLITDPLQTAHFADHLQEHFLKQGILGVPNGNFIDGLEPFKAIEVDSARVDYPDMILERKQLLRSGIFHKLYDYLTGLKESQHAGIIGELWDAPPDKEELWGIKDGKIDETLNVKRTLESLLQLNADTPVFFMFGRLDPGQKGIDALVRAIEELPIDKHPEYDARFIFSLPGGTENSNALLEDLKTLAKDKRGKILFFKDSPDRDTFLALISGASWLVFPSFYEPFGAATEGYMLGTPVLARSTGGLTQQVLTQAESQFPTGVRFHEKVAPARLEELGSEWQRIMTYPRVMTSMDWRMEVKVYNQLVHKLTASLAYAAEICTNRPEKYAKLLANGYDHAQTFDWVKSAELYIKLYQLAVSRNEA